MSSEKTPNLGLHKWAAPDYVQRTEFNDNFAKIDDHAKQVTEQLADSMKKQTGWIDVTEKPYNCVGDGITDNSNGLQLAFSNAMTLGKEIYIPNGIFKVTRPITIIEDYTTQYNRKKWVKIRGNGFSPWGSAYSGTTIKGYNIPANRAVIELLGEDNGAATSATIESLRIEQDLATCHEDSFALFMGDAWFFRAEKVYLDGHNAMLTRCGSSPDQNFTSYAMINTKFEQCYFQARATRGWAIKHEGLLYANGNMKAFDNIVFDSCLFYGLTFLNVQIGLLNNCMWFTRPDKENVTLTTGKLNGYKVDFSTGLWVGAAKYMSINGCYFEDYRKGIVIKPLGGNGIRSISINGGTFQAHSNYKNELGVNYHADSAIVIEPNSFGQGWVNTVNIEKCNFNDNDFATPNTPMFNDYVIKNTTAYRLVLRDNVVSDTDKPLRVLDTASKQFSHNDYSLRVPDKTKSIQFDIDSLASWSSNGKNNNLLNIPLTTKCYIQKVSIISDRVLQSKNPFVTVKKNSITAGMLTYNILSSTYQDAFYSVPGEGMMIATEKSLPYSDAIKFVAGDTIGVRINIDGTSDWNVADAGAKIKIIIDLAY